MEKYKCPRCKIEIENYRCKKCGIELSVMGWCQGRKPRNYSKSRETKG